MNKLKIGYDQKIEDRLTGHFNKYLDACQEIIDLFNSLCPGELNQNNWGNLIFSTQSFLQECLMKNINLEVFGMTFNREKLFDLKDKPAGYFKILNLVSSLEKNISNTQNKLGTQFTNKQFLFEFLLFSEKGELTINQEVIEEAKEKSTIYAKSEKSQASYIFGTKLIELINETNIANIIAEKPGAWDKIAWTKFITDLVGVHKEPYAQPSVVLNINAVRIYDN